ncbi:signal transducer and activator of transcription 1-like isoform X2 [Mercenaria mercenaria]|uniref:signal transducer and activator of transcription 1-like isoform X2 n=1 Tax=Mercenaria mercenaria TaxID=6596 RepID=UPI00234EF06C|nr:signal transducer and activator of transcription 1-like isoform X2 [Mercenaria mercenaria]
METAQILQELQNRVDKIKYEIITTANEVSSLYVDKTSVPVSSVESQHQKGITESTLIEDKRIRPYSENHEKHDTSKDMSSSLLSEINENVYASLTQTLNEVKSIVSILTDHVSTWKNNFKLVYVGLADYQEIDEIASRCSRIGRNIHDLHHEILPLLFNIHVDCEWSTKVLDIYEHKLDSLIYDFTKSTFLVTEQDSCFIRMDGGKHLPVFTVRILAAENLPPRSDKIEAMLLSERDINDTFHSDDDVKLFSMEAKERGLYLATNQIYFTPTKHACFRKLKIKDKNPPEEFTSGEQQYKRKYRTVFTTTFADRRYWTLSLPLTLLHDSVEDQEFLASTSIMWQCCGTDVFKLPLQSDTELPWTKIEDILQAKFLKLYPLKPLSDGNILYLKDMLFGKCLHVACTTDVPDSRIVSFEEFCINETESTSSTQTFWKWVTDAYNVIEKYLIDFWKNGLIPGFISKEEAELWLKDYNTLKHGTFILRFSDHHLPNNGNVQNAYGQLNAYVLTITEKKVVISYLASSVYRKLGGYLNGNDSKTAEPRWVFLIKHSDLPISESDQRHIENATKPGVIFLEKLERLLYKIPDLENMLREHGMHDGLDILHPSEENEESVLAISEYVFRKIGRALEELHVVQVPDGQSEPCWNYIINNDNTLNITRKDQRNIGNSLKPGEKFLEIFNNCKHTLTDLKNLCKTYKMQGILDILASTREEGDLLKTLVDVHIGGEREFREQKLLDILNERRSPDGCQMLRYLYPGEYTLDDLCEKYT